MRVALDAGPLLDPPTGVGRYTAELADALEGRGVEVRRYAIALRGNAGSGIRRWRVPARFVQALWRRTGGPRIERLVGPVDVVHATNFVLPPSGAPGVVTIHDLSFLDHAAFPGAHRLRDLVPWSLRRAAAVLVPTAAVAGEVATVYPGAAAKLVVTHEGVSPRWFGVTPLAASALARMGVTQPYAVAVGTLEPRKNLAVLLRAWERCGLEGWTLVLAGPRGWGPELPPLPPGVVATGWVGDETLPGLVAGAEMFCYPSRYEGFGLPPLEAMAAGTAVIAGRHAAAEEVLADAVVLVAPDDVEGFAAALSRLASDRAAAADLVRRGRARAAAFTWEGTAAATLEAYRRAAAGLPQRQ